MSSHVFVSKMHISYQPVVFDDGSNWFIAGFAGLAAWKGFTWCCSNGFPTVGNFFFIFEWLYVKIFDHNFKFFHSHPPGVLLVERRLSRLTRLECSSIKLATPFFGLAPVSGSPAFISFKLKGLGEDDTRGAVRIFEGVDFYICCKRFRLFHSPCPNKFCCGPPCRINRVE